MTRLQKPIDVISPRPFFGEWSPVLKPLLLLILGLAAVVVFYTSVFAAAHVVAVDNGMRREQLEVVSLWVFALFLLQGLLPIMRFGMSDLPRLLVGEFRLKAGDIGLFFLLILAGAFLLFA